MHLIVSFFSAIVAVAFAGTAALLPDTGINGTIGAFLAFAGALTVAIALGLLAVAWVPTKARGVFAGITGLVAILTTLAAWFLMQNALLATMVITLLELLMSSFIVDRKVIK